jgi:hypothetical protein
MIFPLESNTGTLYNLTASCVGLRTAKIPGISYLIPALVNDDVNAVTNLA